MDLYQLRNLIFAPVEKYRLVSDFVVSEFSEIRSAIEQAERESADLDRIFLKTGLFQALLVKHHN